MFVQLFNGVLIIKVMGNNGSGLGRVGTMDWVTKELKCSTINYIFPSLEAAPPVT